MTEKYCIDCAFCTDQYDDYGVRFILCKKMPKKIDLVTGKKPDMPFFTCYATRGAQWNCGPSAKWFEVALCVNVDEREPLEASW